jgi:hypothetical protein
MVFWGVGVVVGIGDVAGGVGKGLAQLNNNVVDNATAIEIGATFSLFIYACLILWKRFKSLLQSIKPYEETYID